MTLFKASINIFHSVGKEINFGQLKFLFQFISFVDFFWSIQHILLYQISEKASNTNLSRPNLKHASIIFSAEQFRNRPDYIIFNCLIAWILECLNVYYNLVSLFHVSWMVYYFLLEFVTHFSWIQKKYCITI